VFLQTTISEAQNHHDATTDHSRTDHSRPSGFNILTFTCDHIHQGELIDPMKSLETAGWLPGRIASANASNAWNNPSADRLAAIAITRPKEQTLHETAFIDRICSQHFCACSNPVCVGNAKRKLGRYYQH
jgi:hypothetical protein